MKLIIQIPCLNEAQTLPLTLSALPRQVEGFDSVEILVIDDGSCDGTTETARRCGVDHLVRFPGRRGLARAFAAGLEAALTLGADVIVNTDADNQYDASALAALTAPILSGHADLVLGARPLASIAHFSVWKRYLQRLGTAVVQRLTCPEVLDATSGFRAFHREAAARLCVHGSFTYTLETLFQAAVLRLRIQSVPVGVNPPTRPSRLFRSPFFYILRSVATLARLQCQYRPGQTFGVLAGLLLVLALAFSVQALMGSSDSALGASLGCGLALLGSGSMLTAGILATLVAANRRLLEDIRAHRWLTQGSSAGRLPSTPRDSAASCTSALTPGMGLSGDSPTWDLIPQIPHSQPRG